MRLVSETNKEILGDLSTEQEGIFDQLLVPEDPISQDPPKQCHQQVNFALSAISQGATLKFT